jgi:iron complex outermembrane receptor protein
MNIRSFLARGLYAALILALAVPASAQQPAAGDSHEQQPPAPLGDSAFRLGEIVNVGAEAIDLPGVGASVLTRSQSWTFERPSLDQAVNMLPGVSSTFDSNGRRNESDIFVRGFGRWQVPLMMDGVRIYLPADNRLDFGRFLTADVAAVQIQKGYASVLDGPGAMGGAINLVSSRPAKRFEAEGGISGGGRGDFAGSNGYAIVGSRQPRYYLQTSAAYTQRNHWSLSNDYTPAARSLQPKGERIGSDTRDWHVNAKAAYTPNTTDEYTLNFSKQSGEKGAPLNVYNNPPVPANSYWRWPYWDVQNVSVLTYTQLASTTYLKAKLYNSSFRNGLEAYDDATYSTQSLNGRFSSPYDDHAWGGGAEIGTTPTAADTIKAAFYYRTDVHDERQTSRPTSSAVFAEPNQEQSQNTWSVALENSFHATPDVDIVAGISYDKYEIAKAEEFNATRGLFEYPRGGSDAFNSQGAVIWRYSANHSLHASISDRARFPVIFELYSTRYGTATPNPDLGPERATNIEVGWKAAPTRATRFESAIFYSNVRDLIQTVVLPDTTTQTQNVGTGDFYGIELSADVDVVQSLTMGGNYTLVHREINDALQPNLRPTGVPTNKVFLYATWRGIPKLRVSPSLDAADDRWSDVNPAPAFPYVRTGSYTLLNIDATYAVTPKLEIAAGFKNLNDDDYELSWGFPQPGRSFYLKTRVAY